MNGNQLIINLLFDIDQHLGINNADVSDKLLIDEDILNAINILKTLQLPSNFIVFLTSLEDLVTKNAGNFLNTDYTISGTTSILDFTLDKFKKKNRAFCYSDTDFGFFSTKRMLDTGSLVDLSEGKNALLWKQIQDFLVLSYSPPVNRANIDSFLDSIRDSNIEKGFLINKNPILLNEIRHYSYIYFCYLNNCKSLELPSDLKYSKNILDSSLVLDNTKIYEQYFDVYDVINELNRADDLISRFLKLYHILEYLVYRVYLVDIVQRVGSSKVFVREFISTSESMSKYEGKSFVKNFKEIFNSDLTVLSAALRPYSTNPIKIFLDEKSIVTGFAHNNINRIATLVYGLRCCIVHNKESDFHLTLSNSEEYKLIIPLITKLVDILELLVVQKIANNATPINYTQSSLNIY